MLASIVRHALESLQCSAIFTAANLAVTLFLLLYYRLIGLFVLFTLGILVHLVI